MLRNTIQEWLEAHPTAAGYVFVAWLYLWKFLDITMTGAGGGYNGP